MSDLSDVERIKRLEHGMYGFFDDQKNLYVPGVMQIVAESANQLRQIKWVLIAVGAVAASTNPQLWNIVEKVFFAR